MFGTTGNLQRPRRETSGTGTRTAPLSPEPMDDDVRGGWFSRPPVTTIDLYVLRGFLWNYFLFLFVLLGLFIMIDMVVKFDEFVEITGGQGVKSVDNVLEVLWGIIDYYRFQMFRIFAVLGGVVPVVAAAFTLMRMSRNNELAALLSAGVPLLRVGMPIIVTALVLNLILLPLNQEVIVPKIFPQLTRERGATVSLGAGQPLQAIPDGENRVVYAGAYRPAGLGNPTAAMEVFDVIEFHSSGVNFLHADRAVWNRQTSQWDLENGTLRPGLWTGMGSPAATSVATYKGALNPETISLALDHEFVDLLSTGRINQLINSPNAVGLGDLLRVRDGRLASFVLNIVLVLLTIPAVLTREPLQLRTATTRVFVLVGLCMATMFICQNLAGQSPPKPEWVMIWPSVMCFLPVIAFAAVAVVLLDRVKS
ncbi:MAG: LptF/LptG family permease [Tepidisphaeraceae bacterium]